MTTLMMNTGRRKHFTEDEYNLYIQYISDNNGIQGASDKLKLNWHTVNKHVKDKYCSPDVYKILSRKIFKKA
jgi:hypothetical protein